MKHIVTICLAAGALAFTSSVPALDLRCWDTTKPKVYVGPEPTQLLRRHAGQPDTLTCSLE